MSGPSLQQALRQCSPDLGPSPQVIRSKSSTSHNTSPYPSCQLQPTASALLPFTAFSVARTTVTVIGTQLRTLALALQRLPAPYSPSSCRGRPWILPLTDLLGRYGPGFNVFGRRRLQRADSTGEDRISTLTGYGVQHIKQKFRQWLVDALPRADNGNPGGQFLL